MGKHSVMDGTPTLTFMDSICTALADPAFDHGSPAASSSAPELPWTFDYKLEQSIARAENDAAELIASQAMNVIKTGTATRGGGGTRSARCTEASCWCSLCTQGSCARGADSGRGGARTKARRLSRGRTEVVRVVTSESDAFVQAMLAEHGTNEAVVEKRKALF